MHRFDFSYTEYQMLIERCPFTDEEIEILKLRRKGKTRTQISMALNMSDGAVDRRIASIKKKISKEI